RRVGLRWRVACLSFLACRSHSRVMCRAIRCRGRFMCVLRMLLVGLFRIILQLARMLGCIACRGLGLCLRGLLRRMWGFGLRLLWRLVRRLRGRLALSRLVRGMGVGLRWLLGCRRSCWWSIVVARFMVWG